jgi:hypothetical protein
MKFCPHCGAPWRGGNFCGACGEPLPEPSVANPSARDSAQAAAPESADRPEQPGPLARGADPAEDPWAEDNTRAANATTSRTWPSELSFSTFLEGDWRSAGLPVVVAVMAMLAASLAMFLFAGSGEAGVGANLALMFSTVAAAFGGEVTVSTDTFMGLAFSASVMPLGISLLGVSLFYWRFLRSLRSVARDAGATPLVLHVTRTMTVLFAVLIVLSLLGSRVIGIEEGGSGTVSATARTSVDVLSTVVWGLFWTSVVVTVAVLSQRSDLVPDRLSRVWAAAVSPLVAASVALLGAIAIMLLVVIGYVAFNPSDAEALPILLVYLPNLAWMAMGLAFGVPLTGSATGVHGDLASGGSSTGSVTLTTLTQDDGRFWFLPLAAACLLLIGSIVGALRAPSPELARRHGHRGGIAFAVLMLLVAVLSRVSADGTLAFLGEVSGSLHLSYVLATLLGLLWGVIAGIVGARVAPRLPAGLRRSVRRCVGRVVGLEAGPPAATADPGGAGAAPA